MQRSDEVYEWDADMARLTKAIVVALAIVAVLAAMAQFQII